MEADGRRVVRCLKGACVVAVAAVVVVLFAAGAHTNSQIVSLRRHGVQVDVTVSRCRGLLAGSGSNAAGYSCSGTFVLDGRRYSVTIPGNTLRSPGATVRVVAAENDPGVIASVHQLESEHASWRVYVLPTVLLVVLAALVALFTLPRRGNAEAVGSAGTPPGLGSRRG